MSDIQQQLKDKIQELEQIRKASGHLHQLQQRLREEEKDLEVMAITLDKEQQDVEKLEKEGIHAMLHKFLGDRETRLDKERTEYVKASLRFNELHRSVQLIRFEIDVITKKAQNFQHVLEQVNTLIQQREREIFSLNAPGVQEIKSILIQIDKHYKFLVEIDEAKRTGMLAFDFVSKTEQALIEGKRLREHNYDMGRIKYQVDYAFEMASKARHHLIIFANELNDVFRDAPSNFSLEIESLGHFSETLFNNFISDWIIYQKIKKSLQNVSVTRQHLEKVLHQLDQEKAVINKNLEILEEQRKKVIVSS